MRLFPQSVLAILALASIAPGAMGQETARIAKEDFRYDGKDFAYWQTFLRTELKPERRLDTRGTEVFANELFWGRLVDLVVLSSRGGVELMNTEGGVLLSARVIS